MAQKKKLHQLIKLKCKQFGAQCTLHGVCYLCSDAGRCARAVWALLVAASLSLCVYLSHMIWDKFVDNPTFTVVESTHYPIDYISFPAVSVCDPEMIYGPHTGNITKILKLRGFSDQNISSFYASFTDVKSKGYVPQEHTKKIHSALEDLGYNYDTLINLLKKPCDVLIQECVWRSKPVDCSIMFRGTFTILGYCCQFDVDFFRKGAYEKTNFQAGIDISEALDVIVNTHKVLPNGSYEDSYVFLYIFEKHNNLTLLDSAIALTPATYFDVSVDLWLIDSSDDVKALSLDNRKCFLSNDMNTIGNSYSACMTALMMRKVVEQCRCLPFNYNSKELRVNDYANCTWERLTCIYEMLGRVQNDMRDIMSSYECFQKCDYTQYETEAEYIKVDRVIEEKVNGSCRVAIHFADNTCIKYRREVLYTWDQMLANLGGIFGLCVGGSIISVIEILWLLCELLFTIIHRKISGKTPALKKNCNGTTKNIQVYPYLN